MTINLIFCLWARLSLGLTIFFVFFLSFNTQYNQSGPNFEDCVELLPT